jgi:hypothetical protein
LSHQKKTEAEERQTANNPLVVAQADRPRGIQTKLPHEHASDLVRHSSVT